MQVFITGATGFVGSAVARELIDAGHRVTGLVRSAAAAAALLAHQDSLEDLHGLRRAAARADSVIHAGLIHDFMKFKANCEVDRRAIEALDLELGKSGRPLIVTSAIGVLPQGHLVTKEDLPLRVLRRIRVQRLRMLLRPSLSEAGMCRSCVWRHPCTAVVIMDSFQC